jgi:hypothetical protein
MGPQGVRVNLIYLRRAEPVVAAFGSVCSVVRYPPSSANRIRNDSWIGSRKAKSMYRQSFVRGCYDHKLPSFRCDFRTPAQMSPFQSNRRV